MSISPFSRRKLKKKGMKRLAGFALAIVPLSTYWLATRASPFYYSLSMIGNQLGFRMRFIIWGIMNGLLLSFVIIRLYVLNSFRDHRARNLLICSSVFLTLTVFIPFMQNHWVLSKIHDLTAFAFGASIIASLYLFIRFLSKKRKMIYHWSRKWFSFIVSISILLYFVFGSTGIFELFFFIGLSLFLGALNQKLC